MNKCIVIAFSLGMCSCANIENIPERSFMNNQSIPVVPAVVENPYPECKEVETVRRTATLHVVRNARVYLQEGELCQIAN